MSELKAKLCTLFEVDAVDARLWDYRRGTRNALLDQAHQLGLTLQSARLVPEMKLMLELKVARARPVPPPNHNPHPRP